MTRGGDEDGVSCVITGKGQTEAGDDFSTVCPVRTPAGKAETAGERKETLSNLHFVKLRGHGI